jgi:hypothetical protein
MPVPTGYTETIFADYLASVLGPVAGLLGWDAGSVQVIEAVNDALLDLGLTGIAQANTPTKLRGLRALGRLAIWRAVVQATSGAYAISGGGQTFQRDQLQKQALEALKLAEYESMEWAPANSVSIVRVKRPSDPYIILPDTERTP